MLREIRAAAHRADEDHLARAVRADQILDAADLAPFGSGMGKRCDALVGLALKADDQDVAAGCLAAVATWIGSRPPAARMTSGSPAPAAGLVVSVAIAVDRHPRARRPRRRRAG